MLPSMIPSMAESKASSLLRSLTLIANQISYISNSNFKPLIKNQCSHLARRIMLLTPLFHELLDLGVNAIPVDVISSLVSLQEALLNAIQLLHFGCYGSQLYMVLERDQIKCKFIDLAVCFEQALSKISFDKLDIFVEVKEQVELVTAQFRRVIEHFDPPGLQLYDLLLSILNQSGDLNTESAELHVVCEKLQIMNVKDIKHEFLGLHKLVADSSGPLDKGIEKMFVLLKKIEDFLLAKSVNSFVLSSEECSHTDEIYTKLCTQSLVIPDEFRCPISMELMKDPVIISSGQTYERVCIKKWFEAGHETCPKTGQVLSSFFLIPNHGLYSFISNWCEENGVELPKRMENLRLCNATSGGSSSHECSAFDFAARFHAMDQRLNERVHARTATHFLAMQQRLIERIDAEIARITARCDSLQASHQVDMEGLHLLKKTCGNFIAPSSPPPPSDS